MYMYVLEHINNKIYIEKHSLAQIIQTAIFMCITKS